MIEIFTWLVLGLVAGFLGKFLYPGSQGGGILATIILGIVGAIVGGYLAQILIGTAGIAAIAGVLSLPSLIFAVLGSLVVIFFWGLFNKPKES
jgi:uncharacterized membrane protein YeaQ/YmgE (transglycosylase-associated protein family)